MRYVPGLDALRALAAYAVLFGHCPFQSPFLQYLCCILRENSVSLFFVLSGFLISGIVLKIRDETAVNPSARLRAAISFYVRRGLRILPLHYFLIVLALLLSVAGVERQLWYHLSFTTNLYIAWSGDWEGCLFHLWSIATEEQFYLIWPAAILLLRPSTRKRIVIYGIVAAVLYRFITEFAGEGAHFHARYLPIAQLDCFFLGSALADLYTSYAETQPDMVRRWVRSCVAWGCYSMLIGSLSYLLGVTPYFSDGSFTLLSLRLWFAALIGSIAMRPPNPAKGFFYLILIYLGKRSYGIYMYHTMVLYFILRSDGGLGGAQPLLTCAIVFSITTCCAIVSWRYIESPFNQLKSRFPIRGYS